MEFLHRDRLRSVAWIFAYIEFAVAMLFRLAIFSGQLSPSFQWSMPAGLDRGTFLVKRLGQVFAISI
jgi:hypothetical protein